MDNEAPIIKVSHLKKYFPITKGIFRRPVAYVKAVDDISFQIFQGRSLALAGESGCGKTTTARMLLLLENPTDGKITWEGRDITQLSAWHRRRYKQRTQAVFQDPSSSLNPRMRVKDIVSEPLIINMRISKKDAENRVSELLQNVGLRPEDANLFPHEFSGGQRQRIAIARALSANPKMIVLDEPVSSIDVSMRSGIMNLLKDLSEEFGISFLVIAHDFSTIRFMSHEIAIMYLGHIVEQAPSGILCTEPLHPYTQGLIASSIMTKPGAGFKIVLRGEVGSPLNPPPGCPFHPRCPAVFSDCREIAPHFKEVRPGHYVACHLYTGQDASRIDVVRQETILKLER
ncbi:MAG: ATP-binding cassette domain-containing protein [Deltaproteobacteria bacterium]|nr:ATP-binding cassette domain-containing protein [Deltaproteobacteria bacterium]